MSKHKKVEDDRPHPLKHEATWVGIIGGVAVVGSFVGLEQLSALPEQATPVIQSLGSGGMLYASTKITASRGEKHVTPTADPRNDDGVPLVPLDKPGTPPI